MNNKSLKLVTFMIVACMSVASSVPYCNSRRPSTPNWATSYRTLHIPQSMITESNDEKAWAKALCCVYTHVEATFSSNARLVLYDGSSDYIRGSSSTAIMKDAYNDICRMSMGRDDCNSQSQCIASAMAPEPTPKPTQQPTLQPTPQPTNSPTQTATQKTTECENKKLEYKNKKKKNCKWVTKKGIKWVTKKGIKKGESKLLKLCDKDWGGMKIRDFCPKACGTCVHLS